MDGDTGTLPVQPYRGIKIVLAVLGTITLAAGATAVFLSSNDAGAASLVIAGAALLALGVLVERISWVKAGPVELQLLELARIQAETAAAVEAGDRERAAQLSDQAATLVASVSPLAAQYSRLRGASASPRPAPPSDGGAGPAASR
ncbi:hypothetical protein [Agrococcus sp. DT81.2]|uniref:hypothetical protein n=1 Tax=Agrococcus sp. DT81.2 TaxID=3393414 RepID=UPI003CE55A72